MKLVLSLAVATLAFAFGCVATETGNPSFEPEATIDSERLSGVLLDGSATPDNLPQVEITGPVGSVDPAEGDVFAWNLEGTHPPGTSPIATDGSFVVSTYGEAGNIVRLQVRQADRGVSEPLDVRVLAEDRYEAVDIVNACLAIEQEPLLVLRDDSTSGVIRLTNNCAATVTTDAARLQANTGTELLNAGPLTLAPGQSAEITARASSAEVDDIVIIPVVTPAPELRAVTIIAR